MKDTISVGMITGALLFGFILGCMFTHYNYADLLGSIDIEEFNLDLNETQIVDAVYDKMEKSGIIEDAARQQQKKQKKEITIAQL